MKKYIFHPMSNWPMFFLNQEDRDTIGKALYAVIETRKHLTEYLNKRKKQRFYQQYQAAVAQMTEMQQDLAEAIITLSHKEIILLIISWADANKASRKESVFDVLATMLCAFSRSSRVPAIKEMLQNGWFVDDRETGGIKDFIDLVKEQLTKQKHNTFLLDNCEAPGRIGNLIDALCSNCTAEQFISMHAPCEDGETLNAITESGLLGAQLSNAVIEQDRIYLNELKKEYHKSKDYRDDLKKKLELSAMYLTEPLDKVVEPDASNKLDGFIGILCLMEKGHCLKIICSDNEQANIFDNNIRDAVTRSIGSSQHFWRVVLLQLLEETGGIIENKFAPWTYAFINALVKHPLKIKRFKLPLEADKAKAVFGRLFASYLKGYHPDTFQPIVDAEELFQKEPNRYLQLLSMYFALRISSDISSVTADQQGVIYDLFKTIIVPNSESVIRWMRECAITITGTSRSNQTLDEWIKPSGTDDTDISQERQEPKAEELKPETWYYVRNPEAGISVLEPLAFCDSEGLERCFKEHGIDTIIKPESIMNALAHYKLMPSSIRAVMPQEYYGREGWHKIKRGKLRILARLGKNDLLFFHIYPRKEWEYRATV